MAEVLLLHSVLGIRPGVDEAAERMRAAGHVVHVPDLFDGEAPLDSYEAAAQRLGRIGVPVVVGRARAAAEPFGPNLVYAGFSLGAALATGLAARRPGARGAVLMSGAPNPGAVGAVAWPADVPVQVHMAAGDPDRNQAWIDELAAFVRSGGPGSTCEVFDYPGSGHLFADPSLPAEFNAASAELMWGRVLEFLAKARPGAARRPRERPCSANRELATGSQPIGSQVKEALDASRGKVAQLGEERIVHSAEVEARLSLHALPKLRRNVGQKVRERVDRHEMEAHVGLAVPDGRHP